MFSDVTLNPNKLVKYLDKPSDDFTKEDIITFIENNDIKMLNFRYVAGDGRLKTLNFVINSRKHLDQILTTGERVDGSSLFNYIDPSKSDLYVVPRYKTAYVNPFAEIPTVDILCSFYSQKGTPLDSSPHNIVKNAHKALKEKTGMTFEALGELEYYVFSEIDDIYPIKAQKGYQESHPFSKWEMIRLEAMEIISEIGGKIKYGHAEVGNIIHGDKEMVQHEIEFLPVAVEDAADQLVIAKWALREVAYKHGLAISFAPKTIVGHAGSGMHVHTRLVKDEKNMFVEGGKLSDTAKKVIAGFLKLAPSLTAFGNTVPTSFLRLVPHQEAPTSVCWGDSNRSGLVRVPLGWRGIDNMIKDANPNITDDEIKDFTNNQTVEFRSPDGSANIHELLAGLTVAALHGIESADALEYAKNTYIDKDVNSITDRTFTNLPMSCDEAAEELLKARNVYENNGVFPSNLIDGIAKKLKSYKDRDLSERIYGNVEETMKLVDDFLYCG